MTVTTVTTRADLHQFATLPGVLHPDGLDVPLLYPQLHVWWTGRGPQARHGPVEFLLARDDRGRVVGRAITHANADFDRLMGAPHQLFGLTEFTSTAVLDDLVAQVTARAREGGRSRLYGPVALLPNQTGGVITSGFEQRGFVDSPWNPPHHPDAFAALGFDRIHRGQTWICDDLGDLDPDLAFPARPDDATVTVHHGDRRRLDQQLELVRGMLNASFAQLDYYTPISAADLAAQTEGLSHLLDESLLTWAELDGEPVGFMLVVPDISRFVMATGGRLNLFDQVRLWLTRHRYRTEAILIIKGTMPAAQGRGVARRLSHDLASNLRAGGYRTLRSTFVGNDNPASAAQYLAMDGRPLHDTTFYTKSVNRGAEDRGVVDFGAVDGGAVDGA